MSKDTEDAESACALSEAAQPETNFAEFYYGIISKLYDFKCRQILNDIKSALRNMRRLKYEADNIQERILFSYKLPAVRCAYMYAYSVLHSVMVYSELSCLLEKSKRYCLPLCRKNPLKICCLGGGPGMEAIAIYKSINDFVVESCSKAVDSEVEVRITMVDKLPHWRREESAIINAVNDKSNILHMEEINFHTDFVKADLLKPFEENLREKIYKADIITIIKTAASIQEKSSENCILSLQNMMNNVIESMREDSCLFMLDNSGGGIFNNMKKVLQEKKRPSFLKTSLHKEYSLDMNTLQKLGDLMKSKTDPRCPLLPTGKGKVSSCLWIKNTNCIVDVNNSLSNEHQVQVKQAGNNFFSLEGENNGDNPVSDTKISQECNVARKLSAVEKNQQLKSKNKCSKKENKKGKCKD